MHCKDKLFYKGRLYKSGIFIFKGFVVEFLERTGDPEKIKNPQKSARKVDFSEPRLLQCTTSLHTVKKKKFMFNLWPLTGVKFHHPVGAFQGPKIRMSLQPEQPRHSESKIPIYFLEGFLEGS